MLSFFADKYDYPPKVFLEVEVGTKLTFNVEDGELAEVLKWWKNARTAASQNTDKFHRITGLSASFMYIACSPSSFKNTVGITAIGHTVNDVDEWSTRSKAYVKEGFDKIVENDKQALVKYICHEMASVLMRPTDILESEPIFTVNMCLFGGSGCCSKRHNSVFNKINPLVILAMAGNEES